MIEDEKIIFKTDGREIIIGAPDSLEQARQRVSELQEDMHNWFRGNRQLLDENRRLKSIVAKEVSENDEFGAEYVIAQILRNENEELRRKIEILKIALKAECWCTDDSRSCDPCDVLVTLESPCPNSSEQSCELDHEKPEC